MNVWELIDLANRHPRVNILQPGPGVGGHCIAVDPWFIVASAKENTRLIRAAREINDGKSDWVVEKVKGLISSFLAQNPNLSPSDVSVACYGLTFKPDIDDLRESPAMKIVQDLQNTLPGDILIVEPNIQALPQTLHGAKHVNIETAHQIADVHVYLVAHSQFKNANKPNRFVIDTVGLIKK